MLLEVVAWSPPGSSFAFSIETLLPHLGIFQEMYGRGFHWIEVRFLAHLASEWPAPAAVESGLW